MGESGHINTNENSNKAKAHPYVFVGSLLCAKAYVNACDGQSNKGCKIQRKEGLLSPEGVRRVFFGII